MTLTIRPITRDAAFAWIRANHSHLSPPVSWLFGVAVYDGERLCCGATLGRPAARALQDGVTAEITRVATDRTKHAASKAIAALTRAARAIGYVRVISYTRADEAGVSYVAAGWKKTAVVKGREWSCASRPRRPAEQPVDKLRWEAPAGKGSGDQ